MMNFVFTFNPFAIVSLFTALLVVTLIIYIARQKYQTSTLRWLLAVMFVILLWSSAEFFIRVSGNAETAQFFKYWEIAGYILLGPTAVGLSMAYANKDRSLMQLKWLLLLFIPALIFIFAAWTQDAFVHFEQVDRWHQAWYGDWISSLSPFFTFAFIPWLNVLLLFSIVQLAIYYRSLTSESKKRQAKILLIGVVIPTIIGLITDQLFETLTGREGIELATLTTSLSGLWVTYGIIKYQLFEVNPAAIATNIVNAMSDVVVVCNPKWEIEYASPSLHSLLGYEPNQILGQPLHKYMGQGWENLDRVVSNTIEGQNSVEVAFLNTEQVSIPVAVNATHYVDSQQTVLAYVLILVDLRKMRELLRVTEERNKLQATLSTITDGIIGISNQSTISLINNGLGSMFQLTKEQLQNKLFHEVFSLQSGDQVINLVAVLSKMEAGQQQQFVDVVATTANGRSLDINIIVSKLSEESKVDLTAIVTIQNVSKERQLQKMKSNFTYLAAHELRTPLTSINGYLHMLQSELSQTIPESSRQVLDRALVSTEHLSLLVARLLEVSEIEQSRLTLHKKVLPWNEFMAEFIAKYQQQAKEEGWQLTAQNLPHAVEVEFDPGRIEQVFSIVINNALKYAEGVANITFTTEHKNDQIITRIIDQGIGMAPELVEQLFTTFSRADTGFTQSEQGIGLSLFIAKTIITLHGGTIEVESELHQGSTFTITLPVSPTSTLPKPN